jgi:thiol-disulfide isomerase/thioredoxin
MNPNSRNDLRFSQSQSNVIAMKFLFSSILTFLIACQVSAQGIDFFHGTWNEALEESKKQGKPIFVDAYAKWCGPCKRMASTTFVDSEVGEFFNKNFINVKIDAEEGDGVQFRKKYPVSAFPTLFFIDEKGEVIHKDVGGKDVKGLIRLGEMALSKIDYSKEYAAEYEKGKRDPELVFNYVKALNKSGKPSLKISNEYLRTQENLKTEQNLRFIHEAAVEADSRIFTLLIENRKEIAKLVGEQAVKDRIELACENTAQKAIEFKFADLLEEAKGKMKQHHPEKADAFALKAEMDFYKHQGDPKSFQKSCEDYAKKFAKGDAKQLHRLANDLQSWFSTDEKCMKLAEKLAKEAAESGKTYDHYLFYAQILYQNGKKSDAVAAANKSLQLAKEEGSGAEREVQQFLRIIEG